MDRQRLAILLIVIFMFAGLFVYYGVDGFVATKSLPTDSDTVTMSATDFYDYLRPQILKTVTDTVTKTAASVATPGLSPTSLPNVMPAALGTSKGGMHSPAVAQGEDYSNCKPFNKNEWIRKDSIPCYACTL